MGRHVLVVRELDVKKSARVEEKAAGTEFELASFGRGTNALP